MNSATLRIAVISGIIFGIFGAGGNTGRSIFTLGRKDGGSGNVGGSGMTGIVGTDRFAANPTSNHHKTSRFTSTLGGSGSFGNCGNAILIGTKFIFGNTIFIPNSIWDMSI